ncbi:MAG: FkbM family methyltransferase [Verrucomicrobia bacterium]|nr:FkbM family methyltransferase [Verrucomicrobiota bacterium]
MIQKLQSLWRYIRWFHNWPAIAFSRYKRYPRRRVSRLRLRSGGTLNFRESGDHVAVGETFVADSYGAIRQLQAAPPQMIWDIGANIGSFVVWAATIFPAAEYVSFEPLPVTFDILLANVKANPQIRWSAHPIGFGAADGQACFRVPDGYFGQASAFAASGEAITVNMRNILGYWYEAGSPAIDLMKIDCEGGEYAILESMRGEMLAQVKHIVMETHAVSGHAIGDIDAALTASGFRVAAGDQRNPNIVWATRL